MALAPEPNLRACLEVLRQATLIARCHGWAGEKAGLSPAQSKELAKLMDAAHNLPWLAQNWEKCNEDWLRRDLERFDTLFPGSDLVGIYDRAKDLG